ncbi:MAG: Ig-like domain-containing protein [Ignavibacteriae bacterium]|nr:Ig-like domain-containing protein [Ignavibacteriota bacterium]
MLERKTAAHLCSLLLAFFLLQCAGQIPPSGGPLDSTPPMVIRTIPDSSATRVETTTIELEFSEYVDRRSVEESIFISPYVGDLEFDWSGTEVTVSFSDSLRANTTYVLNVGTDVVDLRAKNRMAQGFTLAFTTGDSIDQGFIRGRVFDEKPEGVMVFAYLLDDLNPDTLSPARTKPDYIMQTGAGGIFTLSNIRFGSYRLFAIRDEYRNLLYDGQVDQFGVTTGDIILNSLHPQVNEVWFRLSQEDTAKPFLTAVQGLNRHRIQARFSEPIDTLTFEDATFLLADTLDSRSLGIAVKSLDRSTLTLTELVLSSPLDSAATYRLTVGNVFDRSGNRIDSAAASHVFNGTNLPDTVQPGVNIVGLADSVKGIPLESAFVIRFTEPVSRIDPSRAVTLSDSTMRNVSAETRWLNATDISLGPRNPLASKAWYQITVVLDSISDYQGNGYSDSTYRLTFESLDLRTTGVLEGEVIDLLGEGGGEIFITASKVGATPPVECITRLPKPGRFKIDWLVEGNYTVSAFRDTDSSGNYSYGRPFPFLPSERFVVLQDTFKVRARWGVEGIVVTFRRSPGFALFNGDEVGPETIQSASQRERGNLGRGIPHIEVEIRDFVGTGERLITRSRASPTSVAARSDEAKGGEKGS